MSAAPEQPPRAADVPEAVLRAVDEYAEAAITLSDRRSGATEIDFDCAHREMERTIATALREAREQGAADTARLDWISLLHDGRTDVWGQFLRAYAEWNGASDFRTALDAARAAEPEQPVTREDA